MQAHNRTIQFRVNAALVAAAEAKAHREGMNLSQLMRHALRKEVREAA